MRTRPLAADQPGWVRRLDELHLLTPLRVAVIVFVAFLVTALLGRVINRVLGRTIGLAQRFDRDDGARAQARQQALASSLRSALVGLVWTVAVITIVGEFDVNLGAFVATATVIGGAIGFGAQTLIRDMIGGFFVLAEDQYGVGDEVDLGHATGAVERITLRSVRVRDGDGRIWHVPHGNVVRVANLSKAAQAVVSIEVARSSDVAEVQQRLTELCAELANDPDSAPMLASEPTVLGLTDVKDDRLVFRVVAPTLPGQHDAIRGVLRRLVLAAFADGRLRGPDSGPTMLMVQPPDRPATPGTPV